MVAPTDVEQLRSAVRGRVVRAQDPGYDTARRVWNGMVDLHPALVVRVADADDVAAVLAFARSRRIPLAVRGGGHSVAGNGTVADGVVIDLGALHRVEVSEADDATVRVGGGATLADVDRATSPLGLAVPIGVVSQTGVGGFTLGGGMGWLTRAHGLTVDNLVDADVVTADGHRVRAADDPELLWGLRGGGGNFGVVTSFVLRAHPLGPEVYGANLVYRPPRWRTALQTWEAWTRKLPDEMQSIITVLAPPPEVGVGTDPVLIVGAVWAGPQQADGAHLVGELRSAAEPDVEESGPVPWTAWQSAMDGLFPRGSRAYWKNTSFDRLDEEVISVLERRGTEQTWHGTAMDIHHMGGAFARVPRDATPFPARDARFWLNVYGFWQDPADDAARTAFVRGVAADMAPVATGGTYVNFMGRAENESRVAAEEVYGAAKLARLVALKRRYDPDNVFRRNHNIPPQ
ncbi:FAD-binding oxidoreductase [uncultured Georgenia sp.]|uniref:FAD-binding oxidoreductase n=1 Tax=uncultured Georgenia sp. TaxID=378209 RepID=UPI002611B9BE|nr:FAD-binding oxidoreductase [uncultured Georgenia sp.]